MLTRKTSFGFEWHIAVDVEACECTTVQCSSVVSLWHFVDGLSNSFKMRVVTTMSTVGQNWCFIFWCREWRKAIRTGHTRMRSITTRKIIWRGDYSTNWNEMRKHENEWRMNACCPSTSAKVVSRYRWYTYSEPYTEHHVKFASKPLRWRFFWKTYCQTKYKYVERT